LIFSLFRFFFIKEKEMKTKSIFDKISLSKLISPSCDYQKANSVIENYHKNYFVFIYGNNY